MTALKTLFMTILTVALSILFSIFSTAILSYISIATPIGPWIDPTIALLTLLMLTLLRTQATSKTIALVTVAGSIGGIMATGIGFSFPTLYFLDPDYFNHLLASPGPFITLLASLSFAAGGFGLIIADLFEDPPYPKAPPAPEEPEPEPAE